jgi:4-amino-4-deoxy-L-arabinose transferase-like glycosyltransferase
MIPERAPSPRGRLGLGRAAVAAVVAAMLVLPPLGQRVIATSDEARFPLLARDMMSRGTWFEAYVREQLYRNKPPLYPWLIVLFSRPRGAITEATSQAPVAAAAVAAVVLTSLLGARLFDAATGLGAGLVLATCWGFFVHSQLILPDMIVLAFAVAAGLAFWRAVDTGARSAWVAFYAALAGSVFAKGPVGVLPLAAAAVWLWTEHGVPGLRRLWRPTGLAVFVAITASWLVPFLVLGAGSFGHTVLVKDWVNWFFGIPKPVRVANFLLDVVKGFLPWTLLLPAAAAAVRREWGRPAVRFAALWAAAPLVLLMMADTPRERYALAIYPGAAIVVAGWAFTRAGERSRVAALTAWIGLLGAAALTVLFALGAGADGELGFLAVAWWRRLPLAASAVVLGTVWLSGLRRGRPRLLVHGVAAATVVLLGYGGRLHTEWFNRTNDFKGLAAMLERHADGREARVFGGRFFQVDFYLGREFLQLRTADEFNRFVSDPRHPVVLIDEPRGWSTVRPTAPPGVRVLDHMVVRNREMLIVGIPASSAR